MIAQTRSHRGMTFPAETLTDPEVRRLLDACGSSATGLRNRAMLTVLYRAGLRCQEVLALEPKDVDCDNGTVRVLCGKGRRARSVGLDPGAADVVREWLTRRVALVLRGPLFCTLKGSALDTSYVRRLVKRLATKARIEKRVHPHGLRHTYASELRAEGIDIGLISRALGHSSLRTTAIYLDHVNPQAAIDAGRQRVWSV